MEPVEVKDRILENISLSVKKVGAGTRWGLRMPTVGAERTRPGTPLARGCGVGDSPGTALDSGV